MCVFLDAVTQLQMTLASVQELLVQQQKKIQELTQELANSQVRTHTFATMDTLMKILSLNTPAHSMSF